jgi:hypothetical protein
MQELCGLNLQHFRSEEYKSRERSKLVVRRKNSRPGTEGEVVSSSVKRAALVGVLNKVVFCGS